jgi:hypothetical protein
VILAAIEKTMPNVALNEQIDPEMSKVREVKLTDEQKQNAESFSVCFASHLSPLLNIFQADIQKLVALLQLPRFIDPAEFVKLNLESV